MKPHRACAGHRRDPMRIRAGGSFARSHLLATFLAAAVILTNSSGLRADAVTDGEEALQARDFARAAELLAIESGNDRALYLRSLALFHDGRFEQAAESVAELPARFPDSEWRHKARFLQARALIELRRHREAETIFAAEANRIFSGERKHQLATTLIEFADLLAREPARDELDALPPDFGKALELYRQVLGMEISREFRDPVLFKVGTIQAKLGQHQEAAEAFRSYLAEFDPAWSGAVGSEERRRGELRDEPVAEGRHRFWARLELIRSQIALGQAIPARQNADDLIELLLAAIEAGGDEAVRELLPEARWQRHLTFRSEGDAQSRIDAARSFLAAHPDHDKAPEVSLEIAEIYEQAGRPDEAVTAFEAFIAGTDFVFDAAADRATKLDPESGTSPTQRLEAWKQDAFFRIGRIRFDQNAYGDAIAQWERYVARFPNGSHWSAAQAGIVDAEFQMALDAVAAGDEDGARSRFEEFLRRHPLDDRSRQILFTLGQMHVTAGETAEESDPPDPATAAARFREAIDEWARLISKYPNTEESSLALYRTGVLQSEKLGRLDDAVASFKRLNWGSWSGPAAARVTMLSERSLGVATERAFRTNEVPEIRVTTRNIEKLAISLYPLNLEAYFRKTHELGRIDHLDIDLIEPTRTWEVALQDYAKFRAVEQSVPIPFENDQPGIFVVKVEGGEWTATTLVVRSDIDLILKSSRREVLVYVEDRLAGRPAANAEVLVSDGTAIIGTGRTGEDGVFRGRFDALKAGSSVRVLALSAAGAASNLLSIDSLRLSSGLTPRGHLYTDKPAYVPGEQVAIRAVTRDVKEGNYVVPAQKEWLVQIIDPNGRLFSQTEASLSTNGTLDSVVELPPESPLGSYTVNVLSSDRRLNFTSAFEVAAFKLDRVRLEFEFPREVYFRSEPIEGTIRASYYWGSPASEQQLHYTLPDGRVLSGTTDAEGRLEVRFDPSGFQPGQPLVFRAALPALNIEASDSVFLARLGFEIQVDPQQPVALAGEPFEVKVRTTGADGSPVGRPITLTVLRRGDAPANPTLEAVPWIVHSPAPAADQTFEEHRVETDPETGEASITLAFDLGGRYTLRASGADRFDQTVTAVGTVNVSDDEDSNKLRFFADKATYDVGTQVPIRLHSRVKSGLALLTFEGEEVLSHRVIPIREGDNPVDLTVAHEHFPNFQISVAIMDGSVLRTATKELGVRRELRVAIKPARESFEPGETAEIEVNTTDQLGRPVSAELSLAMVNEALITAFGDPSGSIIDFFQRDARRFTDFSIGSTCGFAYTAQSMRREKVEEVVAVSSLVAAGNTVEQLQLILVDELRLNPQNSKLAFLCASNAESVFNNDRAIAMSGSAFQHEQTLQQVAQQQAAPNPPQMRFANGADMIFGDGTDPTGQTVAAQTDAPLLAAGGVTMNWAAQQRVDSPFEGTHAALNGNSVAPSSAIAGGAGGGVDASTGTSSARVDIDEASIWMSPILTDESGRAVVRLAMPESSAQWRLSAKGCTPETLVGQGNATIITRREFFVELRAPDILQEGDAVPFLAVIHNLTDAEDEATLKLTVEGAPEPFTSVRTAKLRRQGTVQVVFDAFPVPLTGAVRIRVETISGGLADDVARTVPVRPWGLEYASATAGVTDTGVGATLSLPDGQRYHSRRLVITVSPSIEQAIIDLALERPTPLSSLGAGTVMCLVRPDPQSPSSALVAAASALAYARERRADAGEIVALAARVRTLVSALVVSQAEDGSWPWNSVRGDTNLVSTATAYWGLVLASRTGIEVHPATLAAAESRLNAMFPQLEADNALGKSILLHALSLTGGADFSNANRLYRDRASLDETALAYLAATFVNMQRDGFARDLLDLLDSRAATRNAGGREQVFWKPGTRAQLTGSADETTAMILWCHARLNRESPAAARAAEFVLTEAVKPGSTRSLGPIVHALAAYHTDGERLDDDFEVSLVVNDRPLRTIDSAELKTTLSFEIPEAAILAGTNAIRIDVAGRGRIRYAAALSGFSPDMVDPKSFETPYFVARHYYHDRLRYRDVPLDAPSTSPVARLALGQRFRTVVEVNNHHAHQDYFVWEESLPAGALLVRDSVSGNFDRMEQREGRLLLYFKPGTVGSLSYELVAHAPGRYRVLPSVLRDAGDRGRMRTGPGAELEILPPDTESADPYRMNRHERFELATKLFNDGRYADALEHLDALYNTPDFRRHYEKDLARMLLWIHTDRETIDAARIVEVFEVLRERHPDLVIPFQRILVVGRAYRALEEYERAWLVFRAAIQSSFLNDAKVSAVLEDQGQFLGSVAFQKRLWSEYPDSADVATALFGLSQALFQRAPEADAIAAQERRLRRAADRSVAGGDAGASDKGDQEHPEKLAMLRESASLLRLFLTVYPTDPLADDAAFSQVNAFFALKDYSAVVDRAEAAMGRHGSSEFLTSFQYMAALGHFWQRHYEQALASAVAVAQGESRDRDYARYITAQIHHATGNPPQAIEWYRQVRDLYPDAADAIAYFEEKSVSLPEVTTFKPGEKIVVPLEYRNIREAVVQVYKVDLLKLYLRERNLSAITSIDLAGIDPESRATVALGDGQDFTDRTRDIEMPLDGEGAYLVICRGDDLFTSGLVLVTPLKLEIQEDAPAGSVRVNVRSLVESGYVPEVEVKVVGSAGSPIVSGETDLRGIFEAQGVAGTATVIAKAGDGQYAFHRGTVSLGQPPPTDTAAPQADASQTEEALGRQQPDVKAQLKGKQLEMSDYLENIDASNRMLQESNFKNWDTLRRGDNRGVEVKAAQ